jgi:hypothetical protein
MPVCDAFAFLKWSCCPFSPAYRWKIHVAVFDCCSPLLIETAWVKFFLFELLLRARTESGALIENLFRQPDDRRQPRSKCPCPPSAGQSSPVDYLPSPFDYLLLMETANVCTPVAISGP